MSKQKLFLNEIETSQKKLIYIKLQLPLLQPDSHVSLHVYVLIRRRGKSVSISRYSWTDFFLNGSETVKLCPGVYVGAGAGTRLQEWPDHRRTRGRKQKITGSPEGVQLEGDTPSAADTVGRLPAEKMFSHRRCLSVTQFVPFSGEGAAPRRRHCAGTQTLWCSGWAVKSYWDGHLSVGHIYTGAKFRLNRDQIVQHT